MIRGIHHAAISTNDLNRSIAFYCDLLGARMLAGVYKFSEPEIAAVTALPDASGRVVMLQLGNAFLELFEYVTPQPGEGNPNPRVCDPGITHICFDVTDLDTEYTRLKAAGVPFHCEPQPMPGGRSRTTYARDPDGNVVEFQEILNPKSRMALKF